MSIKANQIIQIRNERNEHYKTQHESLKETNQSKDRKLNVQYIYAVNKQHPKIKDKKEEQWGRRNKHTTKVSPTNHLLSPGNLKNSTLTFIDGSERSRDQM